MALYVSLIAVLLGISQLARLGRPGAGQDKVGKSFGPQRPVLSGGRHSGGQPLSDHDVPHPNLMHVQPHEHSLWL
jgi:hypothetical protein